MEIEGGMFYKNLLFNYLFEVELRTSLPLTCNNYEPLFDKCKIKLWINEIIFLIGDKI